MSGVNFRNKDFLRLATIWGYTTSINSLFRLQSMEAPVDTSDPNNMVGILINNLIKEEDIVRQRSLLDSNIFAKLLWKLNVSCLLDSEQRTLFNLVALGCYIGPCVREYVQTTDKNMDYHVYPSGKQVIKAFISNDFQFCYKNSQNITELSEASIKVVNRVRITWRIKELPEQSDGNSFVWQDQYSNLPHSHCTTSGAQSVLPFTTGFNGSLLPEEGFPGLHLWLQDCHSLPGCGKSHAS
jgi:hypothetical protein